MSDILRAPINYGVAAGGQFVKGGSVVFGFENIRPDAANPATLKAIFLDDGLTLQATNPQGLSSDATFDQADSGVLFGDTGAKYSIIIYDANDEELSYIPSYDLSDASASITAQDAANAAAASEVNAAASESNAAASEVNAAASEASALLAKDLAEAAAIVSVEAKDEFQDIYWGSYASEPALSPVGNPATSGDLYFNTTQNLILVFNGSIWQEVASSVTGIRNEYDYTGAAGQSVFAAVYDIGFVDVYLNGVKLVQVVDYAASTGSDITLTTPLSDNTDTINITAYSHVDFTDGSNIPVTATGTTTPRALGDRFADVANVKDFGAVGDGVVDDIAAFTLAIASGKPVVCDRNSTYFLSTPILHFTEILGQGCTFLAPNGFAKLDKTSTFLAVTTDYTAGDRELVLSSTAGINSNSIVSIRSTDLLNTEREYYYKGVNSKCVVKDATTLVLSTAAPFDMPMSTLGDLTTTGVYIYEPLSVVLKDARILGANVAGSDGLYIEGSSVTLVDVECSGFDEGISLQRCVDVLIESCVAYDCDTYGAVLRSCTSVTTQGGSYSARTVGFDTGGNEPNFGCTWISGSYVSSQGSKGLSMHANMWDAEILSCEVQGLNLSGHCVVRGGTLTSEVSQGSNYFYLHVGNEYIHNSYRFDGVHFARLPTIRVAGQSQEPPVGRNKLDSLVIENCTGEVLLYIDLALTSSLPDRVSIRTVRLAHSNVALTLRDDIDYLEIVGSKNTTVQRTVSQLPDVTTPDGTIEAFFIHEMEMRLGNEDIQIGSFGTGVLQSVSLVAGTSFRIQDTVAGVLAFRDCQLTNSSVFRTDGLSRLLSDNTQITINGAYTANITTYLQRDEY